MACAVPFSLRVRLETHGGNKSVGRGSRLGRSEQDEDSTINSPFHDHHHNDNDDSMNYKQTGGGLKDYEPVEVGAQVAEIATSPTNNGAAGTVCPCVCVNFRH